MNERGIAGQRKAESVAGGDSLAERAATWTTNPIAFDRDEDLQYDPVGMQVATTARGQKSLRFLEAMNNPDDLLQST